MASPICEKAIEDVLFYGNALLKFISPNEAGVTGSHQDGFLLPKADNVWPMFTPNPPLRGSLSKNDVAVTWHDGRVTNSVVTWYGQKTRAEYRLTRFGKDFPFLVPDTVGDLLVLIPKNQNDFFAYVLDLDEDIDEILTALGVQPFESWAIYRNGVPVIEAVDSCLEQEFQNFAAQFSTFPSGKVFSDATRKILSNCLSGREVPASLDDVLLRNYETEYRLFQVVERQVCQSEVARLFKDVDDFLKTAASIMNRRKSRAGRSLENHVDSILDQASIPHEMQPTIDGRPDIVIPSLSAYQQAAYPLDKLFIVGVKTTCKDRWRQILNEGHRVPRKHILTLQPGISRNQLNEMHEAGVTLIVPERLRADYPTSHPMEILNIEMFVNRVKKAL